MLSLAANLDPTMENASESVVSRWWHQLDLGSKKIRVRSGRDGNSIAGVKYFSLKLLRTQQSCHPDRSEA
jgi:hypothetical protein